MIRKIFGGTMVLSIVGAVVLGGILAWSSSHTTPEQTVTVGTINWVLHYEQEPNGIIGPSGNTDIVGHGWIENCGAASIATGACNTAQITTASNFPIMFSGGSVFIDHSSNPNLCPTTNFTGAVTGLPNSNVAVNPGDGNISGDESNDGLGVIVPPTTEGGEPTVLAWNTLPGPFQVSITTAPGAPTGCAGVQVAYLVTVTVTSVNNSVS